MHPTTRPYASALLLVLLVTTAGPGRLVADSHITLETGPNWVSLGPAPLAPSAAISPGGTLSPPVSGRATVLAVNPHNRYNVWLGTAGGGLWVTNNQLIGGLAAGDVKPDSGNFDRAWQPR